MILSKQKTYATICCLFAILLVTLCAKDINAATSTWTASDPIESVKGYNIYYSQQKGQYTTANYVDVKNVISCNLEDTFGDLLTDGEEYFFVITAYTCSEDTCTTDNIKESPFSDNEAAYTYIANNPPASDNDAGEDYLPATVEPLFTSNIYPDGAAVIGKVSYDHNWQNLQHNGNFENPIVIAGPSSYNDTTPGVVRLQNISANSFEIIFHEGQYSTDQGLEDHGSEESSYLVIEKGIHQMEDGSTWEADFFDLTRAAEGIQWESIKFSSSFPATPYLFLTVQSTNDEKPIIVRVDNLNNLEFQAAIFAEEMLKEEAHPFEKIGYPAIYSPNQMGELYTTTNSSTYQIGRTKADHNFTQIFSKEFFLQEEQSNDDEIAHVLEQTNALQIGSDFFAQTTSSNGYDPIVIRQRPTFYSNTTITDKWQTVHTPHTLEPPVIIVGPPSYNDTDPGAIRLSNVTDNSFDIKFQEWKYLDAIDGRIHEPENCSWIVLPAGRYTMADGSIWEIGQFPIEGTGLWHEISFAETFSEPPALFLTMQTYNGADTVTVRAGQVTNQDFSVALFEEENNMESGHLPETVGYLAIYSPNSAGTATIGEQKIPYSIGFTETDSTFSAIANYEIVLEEEQSLDDEKYHTIETVNTLAINNTLFAQDISSIGPDTVAIRHKANEDPLQ